MLQREQSGEQKPFDLLPAIDLRGGRVVRLSEGDFARETAYDADPAEVASRFVAAGASWVHVVDLDGARDGTRRQIHAVERIVTAAGSGMRCEVAGGIRREEAVAAVLDLGAARAVVGTAALSDPGFVGRLVARFGAERIAVALDVRGGMAVGGGWVPGAAGVPASVALVGLAERGVRTFIVTAIERDGLLAGPNLALLQQMVELAGVDILASGGVSSPADIETVRAIGCAGVVVGRAIYEGRLDLASAVRRFQSR